MKARLTAGLAALVALAALVLLAGVSLAVVLLRGPEAGPAPTPVTPTPTPAAKATVDLDLKPALSRPVEDSVYPNVGDPGVDALHYDLDLAWDRKTRRLDGTATVAFRSTRTGEQFQLDLGEPLEVTEVTLDGKEVPAEHNGKDLVVTTPVVKDGRYLLTVKYSGTPEPVEAPSTRIDTEALGFTITPEGEVWTMQEPYGAFTWYPVNDQPADKALYDFTITAPADWVGIANGELKTRRTQNGTTVTEWHLDDPASSYLVTLAIGDYAVHQHKSSSGVPISYWIPEGDRNALTKLRYTAKAMNWVEKILGRYPFDTLGIVVVDSTSGMETQTMITLGNAPYPLSRRVIVHELVHQWYGNTVSPTDWRDMWMNEGMTLYLAEGVWEAEDTGVSIDTVMDGYAQAEPRLREEEGPPGNYDPLQFAGGNVYVSPALMWHELRQRIGDERFWAMVKKWPTVSPGRNATRRDYLAWVEKETGEELSDFFNAWLMGRTTPPRD